MIALYACPIFHSFAVESELSLLSEGDLAKEVLFLCILVGKIGQKLFRTLQSDCVVREKLASLPKGVTIAASHDIS